MLTRYFCIKITKLEDAKVLKKRVNIVIAATTTFYFHSFIVSVVLQKKCFYA